MTRSGTADTTVTWNTTPTEGMQQVRFDFLVSYPHKCFAAQKANATQFNGWPRGTKGLGVPWVLGVLHIHTRTTQRVVLKQAVPKTTGGQKQMQ